MSDKGLVAICLGASLLSCLGLAGCVSSPTYGTGVSSTSQLASDVTGILSLAPKNKQAIDYKPRPDLVKPAPGTKEDLPPPQDAVNVSSNPQWPESPEQQRARLRAEATENQDNPHYKSPIISDIALNSDSSAGQKPLGAAERGEDSGMNAGMNKTAQREEYNKRLAETKQGSETSRKYLSEPPLVYREPAASAPTGDVGEDEWKKARRAKAAAKKGGGWSWRNLIPDL